MRVAIGPSSFADADETPLRLLAEAGITVVSNPVRRRLTQEEIIVHLDGVDGLIAGLEPLNREVLASAPRLKAIARVGVGMSNVDVVAAREFGIKISNTPDAPTNAVAELTMAVMLYFARGLSVLNSQIHQGVWNKKLFKGLRNSQILVVGYGRIGRKVAACVRSFGATVMVCDPAVEAADLTEGETLVTLEEGLQEADFVSLHASGEDVIIGEREFTVMKPGAYLLDSARGGLIDEQALSRSLEQGRLAGVWLDAFWREPYDGPLIDRSEALLTPHVATYTVACRYEMEIQATQNLLRDLR